MRELERNEMLRILRRALWWTWLGFYLLATACLVTRIPQGVTALLVFLLATRIAQLVLQAIYMVRSANESKDASANRPLKQM